MLILFETAAGYAIFKLLDEKKLHKTENLYKDFETPEGASKIVKLKHFEKFQDTTAALSAVTASVEGKMSKSLKKLLKKVYAREAHEELAVADAKLGNAIKDKFDLNCLCNTNIAELMRCIRSQMDNLITGLPKQELTAMTLGLAHSLSRYKLKFTPDKVDTMIIQAISLLDDLDKELNNYIMRCREWYGWHFPELGKLISDNLTFVKAVKFIGLRTNTKDSDLSDILPEELEAKIKEAAEISMGTEISDEDIDNISHLCEQVIEISNYRAQLYQYLQHRMMAIAPNVTILVGELVGARLIAHAGSLLNLAKHPASTVQILGAEKSLFRALKTKHDTPKYGLIYHTTIVGHSNAKMKGKMSRMLAAKVSLGCRVDALGEGTDSEIGILLRAKLEKRQAYLEQKGLQRISGTGKVRARWEKYDKSQPRQYNVGDDSTLSVFPKKRKFDDQEEDQEQQPKKKKFKVELEEEPTHRPSEQIKIEFEEETTVIPSKRIKIEYEEAATPVQETSSKKKKKIKQEILSPEEEVVPTVEETPDSGKKKKKRKKHETSLQEDDEMLQSPVESTKKKKKKSKMEQLEDD